MATQKFASELQSLITVNVAGMGNLGVFDKRAGGETMAKPALYRPGGMGPQVAVPALPTFQDLTISKGFDLNKDIPIIAKLMQLSGRANVTVTEQMLDSDGNAFGTPRVWNGILADVNPGIGDGESEVTRIWDITVIATTVSN